MNPLDVVIAVALVVVVGFGFVRGFWLTAFEYAGVAGGFALAAFAAPTLIARLAVDTPALRLALVLLILCGGAGLGSSLAHLVGEPVRRATHAMRLVGLVDSLAGALLTAAVMLATLWYLGLSLSRGPSELVAQQVQGSAILRSLDAVAPPAPAALTRLEQELSGDLLPQLFAGLEPRLPSGLAVEPGAVDTAAVRGAAASTVRIEAAGCGGVNFGSGFVVGPERVITNAHVVSGTRSASVVLASGDQGRPARVVVFDAARDIAILAVPGLTLQPLVAGDGRRGTQAAIVGYPGGGGEQITPAVINGSVRARGRDIYHQALVTREIWVVSGRARPGNSGGPLVDTAGRMVGVVFAGSVSRPGESYALTAAEVSPAIEAGLSASAAVDTRSFDCVS